MPITGPIHGPPTPILMYWYDDGLAPAQPNSWQPWSVSAPAPIAAHNMIWDGVAWVNQFGSADGRPAINVERINGTDQTADDWTLRFRALNDETVLGLAQAMGLPALPTTDATVDQTVRRILERVALAVDTIGPDAGLLRSMGDPGAIATAPTTGATQLKILEDILVALGGITSPQWDSYFQRNTGVAPFAVNVDSGVDGGRIVVSCHASMPVLAGNNASIGIETSNDGIAWCPEFTWTITGGGPVSQQFFNARRYIRMNATAVAGGILTMDLASSR